MMNRREFLKLSADAPKIDRVRAWMRSSNVEDLDSLHKYCMLYSIKFVIDNNKWFYVDDILGELKLGQEYSSYIICRNLWPDFVSKQSKLQILSLSWA